MIYEWKIRGCCHHQANIMSVPKPQGTTLLGESILTNGHDGHGSNPGIFTSRKFNYFSYGILIVKLMINMINTTTIRLLRSNDKYNY